MNSQASIIPRRKRVKTIPYNASPHQIEWNNEQIKITEQKVDKVISLNPSQPQQVNKSQKFHRSQKSEINDELFKKSQDPNLLYNFSLNKAFGVGEGQENNHHPAEFNPDSLFGSNVNQTQHLIQRNLRNRSKPQPQNVNLGFNYSLSGVSNGSFKFENIDLKLKETPSVSQNLFLNNMNGLTQGKDQLMKIAANDLNQFEIAEVNDSECGSQNNSLIALFKNDQTPLLFRNPSGLSDIKHNKN